MDKKSRILAMQGGLCWYCGFRNPDDQWEIEHQTPRSRGGTDDELNLVIACRPCNQRKATMTVEEYAVALPNLIDRHLSLAAAMLSSFGFMNAAVPTAARLIELAREILIENAGAVTFPGQCTPLAAVREYQRRMGLLNEPQDAERVI